MEQGINLNESKSILEFLYEAYTEFNNLDTDQIRRDYRGIHDMMEKKLPEQLDAILDSMNQLCREHERSGFIHGFALGMMLMEEIYWYH